MKSPILGASYTAKSVNAARNRMVNLYPESILEGGKETGFLTQCPGLLLLAEIGVGPIRGSWQFGGVGYVVSGNELYSITTEWAATLLGTISGTGPVSMSDNGIQLFVAANPDGYIYNANTATFAQITDPDFPGAVTVGYLDGYFVFNEPNSQKFWVTSLLDGTAVDPLDFASAEGSPDNLVALIIDHREIWVFGTNSLEVWYNAGTSGFPLARIQGAFLELGCAAPHSIAKMDNSIFWLGTDARGTGIVYRGTGYSGTRISTHAVEHVIQQYADFSDATAYTYQQDGHSFYVLIFPGADTTWVYDIATGLWHERAGFALGRLTRHRSCCQMKFGGKIIVGDYANGKIYALDINTFEDDGIPMKWLRSWRAIPTGQNTLKRTAHHSLQVDCESGVGLITGQGDDPLMFLRWSDDGGHTWSNLHSGRMGKIGEYFTRVIWRRLGITSKLRDRVYEISGTDPVRTNIMGAEIIADITRS